MARSSEPSEGADDGSGGQGGHGYTNYDSLILQQHAHDITTLLDQQNHDLYNLLALARVDLSGHPEAGALRAMLRAPSGLLINSEGQVLFIRLNGTEYETGVVGLLEENERLKAAMSKGSPEPTESGTPTRGSPQP